MLSTLSLIVFITICIVFALNLLWRVGIIGKFMVAFFFGDIKYPNLVQIDCALKEIHHQLPKSRLQSFRNSLEPQQLFTLSATTDPESAVTHLVTQIIRHFKLPQHPVLVSFTPNLSTGMQLSFTHSRGYVVELRSQYNQDPSTAVFLAVHLITQLFLRHEQLILPKAIDKGTFIDTASAYLGVGWLALNSHTITAEKGQQVASCSAIHRTYSETGVGYLTPAEVGYILGKRALWFGDRSGQFLTSLAARRAFKIGFKKAKSAYHQPPLQNRSAFSSWLYRWNLYVSRQTWLKNRGSLLSFTDQVKRINQYFNQHSALSTNFQFPELLPYRFTQQEATKVIFRCPVCRQQLRLPAGKTMTAQCSNCKSSLKCKT